MTGGSTADGVRIELYVRSLGASERSDQARALDRLDALVADGVVDAYRVLVWGARAPTSFDDTRTAAGLFVLDRVSVFRRWADRNDVSVDHPFATRQVDSTITGETYSELTLPRLVLAEYRDGSLSRVVPHEREGETVCVGDYLTRLAAGDVPETVPVERGPAAIRVAGGRGQDTTERPPTENTGDGSARTALDTDVKSESEESATDAEPSSRQSREPRP